MCNSSSTDEKMRNPLSFRILSGYGRRAKLIAISSLPPGKGGAMKILAVENGPRDAPLLERLCREILADRLELFVVADSLGAASARLGETAFDVVLLDPQQQPGNGLEMLSAWSLNATQTIVVSASTDLALRAFECGVLDFVPKPVSHDRLARALRRVLPPKEFAAAWRPLLAVRRLGRIDFVALDDLLYVEGADKYSELVFANGQRNFYDKCLGRLETSLPRSFVRIHKSYLVRFAMVSRLHVLKGSRYFAELKNGLRLPVGRSRYATIKSLLL
jgi:DNA-binding LytR/AlgR family response regulator